MLALLLSKQTFSSFSCYLQAHHHIRQGSHSHSSLFPIRPLQVCERSSLTLSSWVTGRSFQKENKTAGIWTRRHQAKSKGVMSHSKQGFSRSMHPGSSQSQHFPPTQHLQCWQPGLRPSDKSSEKSCLCNLTSPHQPRRKNCVY